MVDGPFIVNEENTIGGTTLAQAEVDEIDWDALAQVGAGDGVVSGMEVTATGAQSVSVATGVIRIAGVLYSHSGPTTVNLDAAHATLPRFDLIECGVSATPTEIAGTAATGPDFPARTASTVWLASVYRTAADNTTVAADIVDKRQTQALEGAWTGDMDAAGNDLTNVGTAGSTGFESDGRANFMDWIGVGSSNTDPQTATVGSPIPGGGGWLTMKPTDTDSSTGGDYTLLTATTENITKTTAHGGILTGLFLSAGPGTGSQIWDYVWGIYFNAGWLASGSTVTQVVGGHFRVAPAGASSTTGYGVWGTVNPTIGTMTRGVGLRGTVLDNFFGTLTTGIAVEGDVDSTVGTGWGIVINGSKGNAIRNSIRGKLAIGGTSDDVAPTWGLDLLGTAANQSVIAINESSSAPTNPASDGEVLIYQKNDGSNDMLVIAYNDSGTMKYRTLTLDDTAATWNYTTTAP